MATETTPATRTTGAGERLVLPAGVWRVVNDESDVRFRVRKLGLYDVKGRFRQVDGGIEIDDEGLPRRGEVVIDAASITTRMPPRDWHLRTRDFLDVDRHPEIRIQAQTVEPEAQGGLRVPADLEIRGNRGRVPIVADFERLHDEDPTRAVILRLRGDLWRHAFGVKARGPFEWIVGRHVRFDVRLALRHAG